MPSRGLYRAAKQKRIHSISDALAQSTHFNPDECKSLVYIYERMEAMGKVDRLRFREILHTTMNLTDDIMLDLIFHAFDRNNDGIVDQEEWVQGLSCMLRGTPEELVDFCYFVYDINGDRSLAREELHQCIRGCIVGGYSVENDEIDECERDIVDICMRKLDKDRDGQITYPDFVNAVTDDPLLIQACGPCLPNPNSIAAFLACSTEYYRDYSPVWGAEWESMKKRRSLKNSVSESQKISKSPSKAIG
jgi:Ca2+-binding EF-hand superfamily protein